MRLHSHPQQRTGRRCAFRDGDIHLGMQQLARRDNFSKVGCHSTLGDEWGHKFWDVWMHEERQTSPLIARTMWQGCCGQRSGQGGRGGGSSRRRCKKGEGRGRGSSEAPPASLHGGMSHHMTGSTSHTIWLLPVLKTGCAECMMQTAKMRSSLVEPWHHICTRSSIPDKLRQRHTLAGSCRSAAQDASVAGQAGQLGRHPCPGPSCT